ncbi:MAG: hypothetical protein AAGF02_08415, partial [Actinomycetota bacterium]
MRGPWGSAFEIDDEKGGPIRLEQRDASTFEVKSRIKFDGDMGLPAAKYPHITDEMRRKASVLEPGETSDLASVPSFVRWFADPYGAY